MELKKWPETEREYWAAIEGLGGVIWSTEHNISHERIHDTLEIKQNLKDARTISAQLLKEIGEKFGVIPPDQSPARSEQETTPAPESKKWYWQWYSEWKRIVFSGEYEGLICSACPLSDGLDRFIQLGGAIPCSVFPGSLNFLRPSYQCGMLDHLWDPDKLFRQQLLKGGMSSVIAFDEKKRALQEAAEVFTSKT